MGDGRALPEVEGVRHRRVGIEGVELHVAEAGEGRPVVLLHGWPQHWWEWREVIPALAGEHRVICPDLRGFGWSDAPPGGYDKETMAGDVIALLDELGVERFCLAGHDWGGWIGYLIALAHPERVERYVAMNIVPPFTKITARAAANQWRFTYQVALSMPLLGPALVTRMGRRPPVIDSWAGATRRDAWTSAERDVFLGQFEEPARRRASVLLYRNFQLREIWRMLGGRYRRHPLEVPTLALHGGADKIIRPVHLEFAPQLAPHLEVELVEGCGHFIVDERPELVSERLLSFYRAPVELASKA